MYIYIYIFNIYIYKPLVSQISLPHLSFNDSLNFSQPLKMQVTPPQHATNTTITNMLSFRLPCGLGHQAAPESHKKSINLVQETNKQTNRLIVRDWKALINRAPPPFTHTDTTWVGGWGCFPCEL